MLLASDLIPVTTLDPLSRLKGIETCDCFEKPAYALACFGSAFPLEGN